MKYIEEKLSPFVFTYKSNLVQNGTSYFGASLGRVANRIGGAQFTLNGTLYKLVPNEGKNMLHGTFTTFPLTSTLSSTFTSVAQTSFLFLI